MPQSCYVALAKREKKNRLHSIASESTPNPFFFGHSLDKR
jgi:hypothetical protein